MRIIAILEFGASYIRDFTVIVYSEWLIHYADVFYPIHVLCLSKECQFLREKCSAILQRFYDSKHHQKKQITSGG